MSGLAIQELRRPGHGNRATLQRFFEEHDFPIVEGSHVTFVYRGGADAVSLRHWIYGLPSPQPLQRLTGTDVWFTVVELPAGARVEYKYEVHRHGRSQWVRDRLNQQLAHDPFGANSVVHADGYAEPDWVKENPRARRGHLDEYQVPTAVFGGSREVQVYRPARFRRQRRHPLLVVHDGADYQRFARLQVVLDNLVHAGDVPPLIAILTQSPERMREYADDERHARFLAEELVPWASEEFSLRDEPESRVLIGASFGAVATLSAAWRHPGVFGKLLLQSGSFAFTDVGEHDFGEVFDPVVRFVQAFRNEPGKPARAVYQCCGTFERGIQFNRSMLPVLQRTGMNVRYRESPDGHNWEAWRDRLREGLSWLLPGPLWMVYE